MLGMLMFRVQCRELSAHYVVVWQVHLVYLQIMALSNVQPCPHTRGYVEGISSTGQPLCSLTALQNSCLIKLEPIYRRGSTVSHTDDPFAAARSSTCLIFGGTLTLVSLSFPGLSQCRLTKRLVWWLVCLRCLRCLTKCLVTLNDEA